VTARNPWLRIGFDAWSLGMEASSVIGLRAFKIAAGGAAARAEASQMLSEKVEAAWSLQNMAMAGGLGSTIPGATGRMITHYRRKVRANQRRLGKY
jgi:hypothetical protein